LEGRARAGSVLLTAHIEGGVVEYNFRLLHR
jgi:hypothetical protein